MIRLTSRWARAVLLAGIVPLTVTCGTGYPLDVGDGDAWIDSIRVIEHTFSSGKWSGTETIRLGDTAWVSFAAERRDGDGIGGVTFAVQPYDTTILRRLPASAKNIGSRNNPLYADFVWRADRLGSLALVFYNATGKTRDGKPAEYRVTGQVIARP